MAKQKNKNTSKNKSNVTVLNVPKSPLAEHIREVKQFSSGAKDRVESSQQDQMMLSMFSPENISSQKQGVEGVELFVRDGEQYMSHIDIAKIAGKRTDNVKRNLDKLVKEAALTCAPQFEERRNTGAVGASATQTHYLLNRIDSITLMAQIDPRFCAAIVQRWDDLESGRAKPSPPVVERNTSTLAELDVDGLAKLAKLIPVFNSIQDETERTMFSSAVEKISGFNCMDMFGLNNSLDLQPATDRKYPTGITRKVDRERSLYGLQGYYSLRELSIESGMQTSQVRDMLMHNGLIMRVEYGKRLRTVLTDKGHRFGRMYDPVNGLFHKGDTHSVLRGIAQPVFDKKVLTAVLRHSQV